MIYAKTTPGIAAMQDRSIGLTPRQRSAFIMFDGKRDSSEVLKMTAGIGFVQSDLEQLLARGLLVESGPTQVISAADAPVPSRTASGRPSLNAQAHYSMAYPIATRLTAALGLRGFRLNLAVEAATDLEKLKELAPKIKEAVGIEKYQELDDALNF